MEPTTHPKADLLQTPQGLAFCPAKVTQLSLWNPGENQVPAMAQSFQADASRLTAWPQIPLPDAAHEIDVMFKYSHSCLQRALVWPDLAHLALWRLLCPNYTSELWR